MKVSFLYTFSCMFFAMASMAQVRSDGAIMLAGEGVDQRQVHGLPSSVSPGAILSAGTEGSGTHRMPSNLVGGDLWQVQIPALDVLPVAGTQFLVQAPAPGNGNIQIMVNGHGPFALTKGGEAVDGTMIDEGMMLSLIHDGTDLQLLNDTRPALRECPGGMVAVNDQFCIQMERMSSDPATLFDAISSCGAAGLRLCSWGEYYVACVQRIELDVTGMGAGWEWTNTNANEDTQMRVMGACTEVGVSSPATARYYRCCLSR